MSLNISIDRLTELTSKFKGTKVMVVGDVMLDEYMWGDVRRISPEAPVPVVEVEKVTQRLGGAANVVGNLVKLGIDPILISVAGKDENGEKLDKMLTEMNCSISGLLKSESRPTTIKTRIMARHQQVVRADRESIKDLDENEIEKLYYMFLSHLDSVSAVLISDYGKGVVCKEFLKKIIDECKKRDVFVAVDPKDRHFDLYKGAGVITPNLKEAHAAAGISQPKHITDDEIASLGWKLIEEMELKYLLLTLSEKGMAVLERDTKGYTHLPTVAREVFDVTGAGDTVISVFTSAIACGATAVEAAFIANHAAGITVAELGTAAVTVDEIVEFCKENR